MILELKAPVRCVLWEQPTLVREPQNAHFERVETYVEESHLSRSLLRCRECGQLYFFEFYEEIDWVGGEDPQYCTWVPVETQDEIEALKKTSRIGILDYFPRLQKDWPKEAKSPTVKWMGKD